MLSMSIIIQGLQCPNCGSPLPDLRAPVLVCSYCDGQFLPKPTLPYRIPDPLVLPSAPHLAVVRLRDRDYLVHGRLARGTHCDVFLARRAGLLTEMVILKVARRPEERLLSEWEMLHQLLPMDSYLGELLPQPVAFGLATCSGQPALPAAAYRWRSGFSYTLVEARAQYPKGVPPEAVVWMANRLLDQLTCLHRLGFCHGDLQAEHLLLHPRDHGLLICSWSQCCPGSPAPDLNQGGQALLGLLGPAAPRPLRDLLAHWGDFHQARQVKAELARISRQLFGPPRFHRFHLK